MFKYFLIVALVGVIFAEECRPICPQLWSPVCTQDQDGVIKQYDNDCLKNNAVCRDPKKKLTIVSLDQCATTKSKRATCAQACTFEYAPVCGENNENQRIEFPNQCAFDQKKCQNPTENWRILPGRNACNPLLRTKREECSPICPALWSPVCTQDQDGVIKQYDNDCLRKNAVCRDPKKTLTIVSLDQCRSTKSKRDTCAQACTFEYAPVCGENNQNQRIEFPNQCAFDQKKCQNPTENWRILPGKNACNPLLRTKRSTKDANRDLNKCPNNCRYEYATVCGENNQKKRQSFINQCVFELTQCQNPGENWKVVNPGKEACVPDIRSKRDTCAKVCTLEYAPVCGVNSENKREEFPNQCAFDQKKCENPTENWRILPGRNACNPLLRVRRAVLNPKCSHACPDILLPVCAVNKLGKSQTFANDCEMGIEQCENEDADWKMLRQGNCD